MPTRRPCDHARPSWPSRPLYCPHGLRPRPGPGTAMSAPSAQLGHSSTPNAPHFRGNSNATRRPATQTRADLTWATRGMMSPRYRQTCPEHAPWTQRGPAGPGGKSSGRLPSGPPRGQCSGQHWLSHFTSLGSSSFSQQTEASLELLSGSKKMWFSRSYT